MGHYDDCREQDYNKQIELIKEDLIREVHVMDDSNLLFLNFLIDDIDSVRKYFNMQSKISKFFSI